ncbi:MAG: type VI secretion system baseplate subunit TssK [Phycisphaeraceae bacterium]|nr:MAG: type VI secretion system baseplate subunit TssK [Phycisphaeraceae bacterium]
MATIPPVHWHEGLFLQPHHLQAMQRHLAETRADDRRAVCAYPYGLVESRLSTDALENMLVRFDRLDAIMPSGTRVTFPGLAELPPMDIKKRFEASSEGFTILLGVPLWYEARANTIDPGGDDWRAKRLYRIREQERPDENTGENRQPMMHRLINARLMYQDDDQTDMEVMPVLRVVHGTGEGIGMPRIDPNFIPPCFAISGSVILRELVRDLTNAVEASRREMVVQMTRGGFSVETMRGSDFQQMLRLKTINRFSARLPHLLASPAVSPSEMYLEFRDLLAELAALHPDRDPFDAPPYDHDAPAVPFHELSDRIREYLRPLKGDVFRKVPFVREGPFLKAPLSAADLTEPNEYYIGIKTREDPRAVAMLVEDEDKFKLTAPSMWQSRIRGVKVQEERHPPVQFPAETGLHYFRINRAESQRMWDRVSSESAIAAWWPGLDASDYSIALYMTLPGGGG